MKHFCHRYYTLVILVSSLGPVVAGEPVSRVDRYNVRWTTQSENSADSMPCVGGDMGLNVWVEDNELLFYVGREGCRDENGSLLKMGRVRIAIEPSPFSEGAQFSQTLKLKQGLVEIRGDVPEGNGATIRIWVEIDRPIVHAEIETSEACTVRATYESWRTERIELPNSGKNLHRGQCLINYDNYPEPVFVYPDAFRSDASRMRFWHQMREDKNVFHHIVKTQKLEPIKDQLVDPCRNLIFGGEMIARSWTPAGEKPYVVLEETKGEYALTPFKGWTYQSPQKARKHRIDIVTLIKQTESIDQWYSALDSKVDELEKTGLVQARKVAQRWWDDFWARSYLVINPEKNATDTGWRLARNYNLFRYMLASGRSGREPIMFNGGVLTFDPIFAKSRRHTGPGYTPDHRQWGSALTAQNQRCMYWPMLKSGDFDLMIPGFDFYGDGLNNASQRVRHYWNHDGCAFTEQTTIQALPGAMVYGYQGGKYKGKTWRYRPDSVEPGVQVNGACNYLYESQLEWSWMILQYHQFTGHDISPYLPLIEQSVIFYDEHYRMREKQRTGKPLTPGGRLHIKPANTLEGHPRGANPTSVIAGLRQILTRLTELPEDYTSAKKKTRWLGILTRLPDMPTAVVDGHSVLRPTADHASHSWHMPSMYPLYPYQMFQLGRPGVALMRETFLYGIKENARHDYRAWNQGVVHYAHLGMTEPACDLIIKKLDDGPYRFPAFWPPLIDWAPDHNWGGMGMIGLQEMLMQTFDNRILLLPAWPKDWDVAFRFHAPDRTTVEAKVVNTQVEKFIVSPEHRRKDVEIWKKVF
ncbi:MAG: hypothetical protein GY809_32850 [Planctomycetes bacterium]|nr:hypothetical protein [Planctomycetota bacterium]